jgi:hypothetical protein
MGYDAWERWSTFERMWDRYLTDNAWNKFLTVLDAAQRNATQNTT